MIDSDLKDYTKFASAKVVPFLNVRLSTRSGTIVRRSGCHSLLLFFICLGELVEHSEGVEGSLYGWLRLVSIDFAINQAPTEKQENNIPATVSEGNELIPAGDAHELSFSCTIHSIVAMTCEFSLFGLSPLGSPAFLVGSCHGSFLFE